MKYNVAILSGTENYKTRTSIAVKKIENYLRKIRVDFDIKVLNQEDIKAKNCTGCCSCFKTGKCVIKDDNIESLKKILIEADIIICVSPVYFHQVSGTMKTFIDRLSYWSHIFKLAGKIGMAVSVSSTNGNEYVDLYLKKFMEYLGVKVESNLDILNEVDTEDEIDKKIETACNKLINSFDNIGQIKISQKQDIIFHSFQINYKQQTGGFEKEYWQNNNYFYYGTFQELWEAKCRKLHI